jgi:hypothetical protein
VILPLIMDEEMAAALLVVVVLSEVIGSYPSFFPEASRKRLSSFGSLSR